MTIRRRFRILQAGQTLLSSSDETAAVEIDAITPRSGTAILDFGPTPSSQAQIDVSGQAGITVNSRIRTWLSSERHMSDNDENSHLMAGLFMKLVAGDVVPDTGFTIYALSMVGLATGRFRVDWLWSI